MSRRAFPYRTAPEDVVKAEEWTLQIDGDQMALPEALPDWDYQMRLDLRRAVRVDLSTLQSSTGLPATASLALVTVWAATGSGLRAPASRIPLTGTGTLSIDLAVDLDGRNLGGLLTLDTILVLADYCSDGAPAAPRRAGSVLWSDRREVRLQGDAPQFPIAVVDFAKTSFPEDAAWHVQVVGNLETATMGALLLLVNEKSTAAVKAFQNAATPRAIDRVILSAVYTDVARTLVEHALLSSDFDDENDFDDESLGATLQNLIGRLFPNTTIDQLRRRREQSPGLFSTEVQAAVKIFEDVK
ncbi:hypothetical protein SAMN04489729_4597 [Amycolatopsis lurida]|uniref:Uncharacterized protein n=1 Tax=Amycolatopsis lurida NRRL 2430 TaxID=1460371 RepID=A0A2P2FJR0_AMYLU|nr:hypothetical protein [Amycolatopsis lurida]KFU76958.1 hypothetical protein BB31_33160 [Amycolatopsis lurida NRRL 2430]SED52892.1 hypothetical protein SAMN04489729_4597 [Amycolatopsis lurida]